MNHSEMSLKEIAVEFQRLIASGEIDDAYERYVHADFTHHNAYFKPDRESLKQAMKENAAQFPHKNFDVQHALEDGEFVAIHALLRLDPSKPTIRTFHLFRFKDNRIIELWDAAQEA